MSDQRKVRQELRQGLHQFLMQTYSSYCQSHSQEDAKALVRECIEQQYEYFAEGSIASGDAKDVLQAKVDELTKIMGEQQDYDSQLYFAEKIDTLTGAIELLDYKTK